MDHLLKLLGFLLILQTVNAHGCDFGLTAFGGVHGCFKIFNHVGRTWFNAKDKCDPGTQLVKPSSNADAIRLRKALLDTYGTGTFWLGAKADGHQYIWEYDHSSLSNNSPLWIPDLPSNKAEEGQCLTLSVNSNSYRQYPDQPYGIGSCSAANTKYATICEAVCLGGCGNGECTGPYKCTCDRGYTGYNCEKRVTIITPTPTVTHRITATQG